MRSMKKIASIAVAGMLALGLFPAMGLAAEESGVSVEIRTVRWVSTQDRPDFEETIDVAGVEYALRGEPAVKEIGSEVPKVAADHHEERECAPGDLQSTIDSFPGAWSVESDGYRGEIPLMGTSYEAVFAERSWEVNVSRAYAGLPDNDVASIAASIDYDDPDTGHGLSLRLAGISWTVDSADANGMPTSYSAECIYRGVDSDVVVDHYVVTATYAGEVSAKEPVKTYEATLTYEGPGSEASAPAENKGIDWLPIVVSAAAVAAAGGAGAFFWRRRRNVKLCKMNEEKNALDYKAGMLAVSGKKGYEVDIPATCDIEEGAWVLVLDKSLVGDRLKATWCGQIVYDGPTNERIELM